MFSSSPGQGWTAKPVGIVGIEPLPASFIANFVPLSKSDPRAKIYLGEFNTFTSVRPCKKNIIFPSSYFKHRNISKPATTSILGTNASQT